MADLPQEKQKRGRTTYSSSETKAKEITKATLRFPELCSSLQN
jgi:hypothetical protein